MTEPDALVRAVQAERKACARLAWREAERHAHAEEEAREAGDEEEADRHKWDAETLARLAEAIERRPA